MADSVDVTFYVQLEPVYSDNGDIHGATAVRMTKFRPTTPRGGTVLIKLTTRVAKTAFEPLRGETVIAIPDHLTEPVQVTAAHPGEAP